MMGATQSKGQRRPQRTASLLGRDLAPAPPTRRGQLDPGRRMIARFGPGADLTIHPGTSKPWSKARANQNMIHPKPSVSGEGVSEVVPIGVDRLARVHFPNRVRPSLSD